MEEVRKILKSRGNMLVRTALFWNYRQRKLVDFFFLTFGDNVSVPYSRLQSNTTLEWACCDIRVFSTLLYCFIPDGGFGITSETCSCLL